MNQRVPPPHPDQPSARARPSRSPLSKHVILFLAANPAGTDRLALDEEARAIQEELERSGHRDKFELVTRWAVRPMDLLRELRKLKPTIVHFSGHGGRGAARPNASAHRDAGDEIGESGDGDSGTAGLYFQGPDGGPRLVSTEALQKTFGAAGSSVRLVVLNACYGDAQVDALLAHVDCVVGMNGVITDEAARSFAIGFYGGLGEQQSVAASYNQGCAAITLEGSRESDRPQLRARVGVYADRLVVASTELEEGARDSPMSKSRGWVWRSTIESAEAGSLSVLAMAETVTASAAYVWIAWRFGTLHLTISACVAPLLLLRTSRSVSLALKWADSLLKYGLINYGSSHNVRSNRIWARSLGVLSVIVAMSLLGGLGLWLLPRHGFCSILVNVFGYLIFGMLGSFVCCSTAITMLLIISKLIPLLSIRLAATVVTIARAPLISISEIPRNWWNSTASVDVSYPLEMLPGAYRRYGSSIRDPIAKATMLPQQGVTFLLMSGTWAGKSRLRFIYYAALPFILITILFFPLLFRWSLEGVALIYSPFIWIAHGATARPIRLHLQDIVSLAYYRIGRVLAVFVLILFSAKLCLHFIWNNLDSSWKVILGQSLLDAVVMPERFPPWHIVSVANALLAWFLYVASDWVLARLRRGLRVSENAAELALRVLFLLRGVLSVYTIFCLIYLAASLSGRFDLPPIGTRILPWH